MYDNEQKRTVDMENNELLSSLAVEHIKTQSDYLADKIKAMIVSEELQDGFTFPNEAEFCKLLNVSRSTLREAYKILDTQGFIRRTKRGTYIRSREEIAEDGNFSASLELSNYKEMCEFVCALEPEAVCLAAQKITDEELAGLHLAMEEVEACGNDFKAVMKKNKQFHEMIRRIADNTLIMSALSAYYDSFSQQIVENIYSQNDTLENLEKFLRNSLEDHRELYEAMKAHDGEKARAIELRHLVADLEKHEEYEKINSKLK